MRKKTKFVNVRLDPETHAAAMKVADFTGRTFAGLVSYVLEEYIGKNYPDANTNKALVHDFDMDRAANGD